MVTTWATLGVAARGVWLFQAWRREQTATGPPPDLLEEVRTVPVLNDRRLQLQLRLLNEFTGLSMEDQHEVIGLLAAEAPLALVDALREAESVRYRRERRWPRMHQVLDDDGSDSSGPR